MRGVISCEYVSVASKTADVLAYCAKLDFHALVRGEGVLLHLQEKGFIELV